MSELTSREVPNCRPSLILPHSIDTDVPNFVPVTPEQAEQGLFPQSLVQRDCGEVREDWPHFLSCITALSMSTGVSQGRSPGGTESNKKTSETLLEGHAAKRSR